MAEDNGVELNSVNLYIGGCGLDRHWKNARKNDAYYRLELNGNEGTRRVSLEEALCLDNWDIITLQQVSYHSGMYQTYEPYLSSIVSMLENCGLMQSYIFIKCGLMKSILLTAAF